MLYLKRKLEIAFALVTVLGLLVVVFVVTGHTSTPQGTYDSYPYPGYPYPSLYLPVIHKQYQAPTVTPTPSPTPTPLPTPTSSPTPQPLPYP